MDDGFVEVSMTSYCCRLLLLNPSDNFMANHQKTSLFCLTEAKAGKNRYGT